MLSLVVLARLLPPEAFGLVAMVTSVLGVAELLRDAGLSSAAITADRLSDGERTNLFWVNVAVGSACAVAAAAAAPVLAHLYDDERVAGVTLALAGLLVVSGVTTQFRAELSRSLRFRALAAVDLVAQAVSLAAAITAAWWGAGYWSIVAQQAALVLATCLLCVGCCRWRPGRPRRSPSVRRFLRTGGSVLGTQVLGYTTNNADNLALGVVWGAGPLGVYSRAYQLLVVPLNQVNNSMSRVVVPILSRVHGQPAVYQRYVERAQQVGTYALAPLFAVAAGLSTPLVAVLFGPGWSAVGPIFLALAVGGVFRGVGLVTYWVFLSSGRAGDQLRLYLLARPVMIGLILLGLPYGPVGVAVGHSVAFAAYWVVSLRRASRCAGLCHRRLLAQALRALLGLALPCGVLAHLGARVVSEPAGQLLVGGALAAAYAAAWCCRSRAGRAELRQVAQLLRHRQRPAERSRHDEALP